MSLRCRGQPSPAAWSQGDAYPSARQTGQCVHFCAGCTGKYFAVYLKYPVFKWMQDVNNYNVDSVLKKCYSATVAKVQVSASRAVVSSQASVQRVACPCHGTLGAHWIHLHGNQVFYKNIWNNPHVYSIYLEIFVILKCSSLSCEAGVCLCADVWSPLPAFTLAASASSPLGWAGQGRSHDCSAWQHRPGYDNGQVSSHD